MNTEQAAPCGGTARPKATGRCKTPLTGEYPMPTSEPGAYRKKTLLERIVEVFAAALRYFLKGARACMPKINLGIGINLFRFNGG